MSDEHLRELERRWKESGAVEDESAYLLERVRVGTLEREKLELVAFLRHPAACLALGEACQPVDLTREDVPEDQDTPLTTYVRRLGHWGKEVLKRACLAMGWKALFSGEAQGQCDYAHRSLLCSAEQLLLEDSRHERETMRQAKLELLDFQGDNESFAHALDSVLDVILSSDRVEILEEIHSICFNCDSIGGLSPDKLCDAVQEELIPWVLDYSDPVCVRVRDRIRHDSF